MRTPFLRSAAVPIEGSEFLSNVTSDIQAQIDGIGSGSVGASFYLTSDQSGLTAQKISGGFTDIVSAPDDISQSNGDFHIFLLILFQVVLRRF